MMCEHFLGSHKFKNQVERRMWRLHADGLSIREIAKAMGSTRDKVDYALKRLKKIMRRGY